MVASLKYQPQGVGKFIIIVVCLQTEFGEFQISMSENIKFVFRYHYLSYICQYFNKSHPTILNF